MLATPVSVSLGCLDTEDDTAQGTAACAEAATLAADDCATVTCLEAEPRTCTYGEISIESDDCGCHAELALYEALCDAGIPDGGSTIAAGLVCEP